MRSLTAPDGSHWTQHPELLTREQLITALECVDNLTGDYARGEARGGSMEWDDLDATHAAALVAFPGLYELRLAEILPEYEGET